MSAARGATTADVVIVGAGAMGSAAAYALAARGVRVVALDRWAPPHAHGSTHGRTRIIREAYFEHPSYVPLVRDAYARWAAIAEASGQELFRQTGGLMVGPPDGELVTGAEASARAHGVAFERLSAREVRARFPGLEPGEEMVAVLEPRAGILFPERCVDAMLALARRHGAAIHVGERVTAWRAAGGVVTVTTDRARYEAPRLVLAPGAWFGALAPDLPLPLAVERQVMLWLAPRAHAERFRAERSPVALWEYAPGRIFYHIPDVGHGVKVALHHGGEIVDPDAPRDPPRPAELEAIRALAARVLPDANGRAVDAATCLYTNAPDGHFVIDAHPAHPEVLVVSACSGHGFKFASAIGAAVAELVVDGAASHDLSRFRFSGRG
ncbi:MAG: N-methyl-L-tryptophan oxidase [Gemmatimonadaceae bacterium]|nr:N-methyl-L-tryptophan oxidase [Gemmatimonadaceae bacterium]